MGNPQDGRESVRERERGGVRVAGAPQQAIKARVSIRFRLAGVFDPFPGRRRDSSHPTLGSSPSLRAIRTLALQTCRSVSFGLGEVREVERFLAVCVLRAGLLCSSVGGALSATVKSHEIWRHWSGANAGDGKRSFVGRGCVSGVRAEKLWRFWYPLLGLVFERQVMISVWNA